ncbi:MAG: hypothetical protein HMLIMOIP_001611 [Candidatus Nitrosomirales archaeon]|jgi:hypothetical protein
MFHIIFASLIVGIETLAHMLGMHLGLESLLACQCHFVQQEFHSKPIKQALYNKITKKH